MNEFNYFQPTELRFGRGRAVEVGPVAVAAGGRALLVTVPVIESLKDMVDRVAGSMKEQGVAVVHFDGVVSNPTTESVNAGTELARKERVDMVVGLGGGSSMDTAKAIAVGAVHEGTAWDYLYFKKEPGSRTLPVIAITTTSGTGSHVTQVAVLTDTGTRTKSAIYHRRIFPRVSIVDPELMVTVPVEVTASTGFDVFSHAFEAFIHVNSTPFVELWAVEAMKIVASYLPRALQDGGDVEAREKMAWADTLAGLCIANSGVSLPHGIGMTIGGCCPHVMHGQALAVVYQEFVRFTWAQCIEKFAVMGRILDPALTEKSDEIAAEASCKAMELFLHKIGMRLSLEDLAVSQEDLTYIADNSRVLPDYKNNPRIASRDEIYDMLQAAYRSDDGFVG